jgi:hypothetical protein
MGFETSKEMFINMNPKDIPRWNPKLHFYDQEKSVLDFYEEELKKIKNGVNIGGYKVPPLLYFHLNFFITPIPQENGDELLMNPPLDDNIYYIVESYEEAKRNNNILFLFGTRGFIKSTFITSLTQQTIITKPNGNFSIVGGSEPDLTALSSLMEKAFNNINPALFIPTLTKEWESHIEFGVKDKQVGGKRHVHAEIMITNADKGTNKKSEKGAGLSPVGFVIDEAGKFDMKKILESAIPSFKTQHGFKLVPILSGTSGNTALSKDARAILEDPKAYNVLPVNFELLDKISDPEFITWEHNKKRKNFGTFVPGQMSYRIEVPKIKKPFTEFLGIKNNELSKLDIFTTDWKNATEYLKTLHGTGRDESKRNRERMYFPLELDDCFLTTSPNPFPTTIIDRRIRELEDAGALGRSIKLVRDANKFSAEFSQKRRAEVSHPGGSVDSPIIVYDEVPETPPERFLHVSGLDDYKQNVSDTDSLGAFYIIKRRNLSPNTPCETITASLTTRPERHRDFHVQIENMIECWSAECLMESADTSFIEYLDTKMKATKWLAPAITFANKKGTKTSLTSAYGLYPTTGNNEYRMNLLIDWCWEQHTIGVSDDGTTIVKYGVEFLDDLGLLKEMRDWKKEGNFDRIAAFSHALVHAVELDKDNVRPKSLKGQKRGILDTKDGDAWNAEKPSSKLNSAFGTRRVSGAYTMKRR